MQPKTSWELLEEGEVEQELGVDFIKRPIERIKKFEKWSQQLDRLNGLSTNDASCKCICYTTLLPSMPAQRYDLTAGLFPTCACKACS